ncbi:MAG: hypothetical protein JWM20_53 [Patescibacteria group bacterium]|nr:hypothetical protein [Patescibacteria group bacterium]
MIQVTVFSCDPFGKAVQDDISFRIQKLLADKKLSLAGHIFICFVPTLSRVVTFQRDKSAPLEPIRTKNTMFIRVDFLEANRSKDHGDIFLADKSEKEIKQDIKEVLDSIDKDLKHICNYVKIGYNF